MPGNVQNGHRQDLKEHEWGAAVLVDLDLSWQDIDNHWSPDRQKPERALETIRLVRDKLDGIICTCLANVLTPDINDRLLNLDIGQPLDLEFVYGEDFPRDPKMRRRLILEVAQERHVIKEKIRADLKRYIVKETSRRPLIMPVILEV